MSTITYVICEFCEESPASYIISATNLVAKTVETSAKVCRECAAQTGMETNYRDEQTDQYERIEDEEKVKRRKKKKKKKVKVKRR